MTIMNHTLSDWPAPWMKQTVQVCWTSTRSVAEPKRPHALGRVDFVLSVEPISPNRAMAEAWVESAGHRRSILTRQSVRCVMTCDNRVANLELSRETSDGDERLAALTLHIDMEDQVSLRPLYARTPLLAEAGFAGGTYDPPTIRHIVAHRAVATA